MNPAPNLVLVGPMGAGKTCIGRALAARFGLAFADADHEIERDAGASVSRVFEREGEAGFRQRERAVLVRLLAGRDVVLATGGGAVLDADNRKLLRERGFVVHLEIDVERQLQRLAHDRSRPLLETADREATLRALAAARAPLYREVADLRFDTGALAAVDAAEQLAQRLDALWQRQGAIA